MEESWDQAFKDLIVLSIGCLVPCLQPQMQAHPSVNPCSQGGSASLLAPWPLFLCHLPLPADSVCLWPLRDNCPTGSSLCQRTCLSIGPCDWATKRITVKQMEAWKRTGLKKGGGSTMYLLLSTLCCPWKLVRITEGRLPGGGWVRKVKAVRVVRGHHGKLRALSHLAGGWGLLFLRKAFNC